MYRHFHLNANFLQKGSLARANILSYNSGIQVRLKAIFNIYFK